jgi:hypothetical protein
MLLHFFDRKGEEQALRYLVTTLKQKAKWPMMALDRKQQKEGNEAWTG